MVIYISIGINIKNIRKNNNLTQEEMSEEIYCSVQALSKFERGLSIPDVNILKTISEKFNVDLNKIIYDENSFDIEEEIFNLCIKMLSNNEIPSIEKISYKTTVSIKRIKRLFKNDNNNLILFIIKSIDVSIKEELSKIKL
ncbi:helix-turn-helix transcriptional regulator [Apilactobacillus kunkeei]|nr:helix-turn-helix transcriptional regulator [Apilactobacillus kunkeei]